MPKVDHLAKLFEAVSAENWTAARTVAAHMVDAEEEKGHHSAAERLRGALHPNGRRSQSSGLTTVEPNGSGHWLQASAFLSAALTPLQGSVRLEGVELRGPLRGQLEGVLREWRHRDRLEVRRIERRRKLLLHGPPGCGKSFAALALGNEMGMPTYVVRVDAVVGAYLGQTALRIRELFHFAESTECVLLLDEIDALGKRRGNPLDVGELDRVVISLMQELEHAQPRALVIATSNLPRHLDEALFRRFDAVFAFPRPTKRELVRFAKARALDGGVLSPAKAARLVERSRSFAEASRVIAGEERASVLREIED